MSSAFDQIHDPTDPAWSGHAHAPTVWWQRRVARVLGAVLALALLTAVALWLGSGDGADAASDPAPRSTPSSGAGAVPEVRPDAAVPQLAPIDPSAAATAPLTIDPATAAGNAAGVVGDGGDVRALLASLPVLYIGAASSQSSTLTTTGPVFGDMIGLDPALSAALSALAGRLGTRLEVVSGLRTHEEQIELHKLFLAGTGNPAAVPGTSHHETGTAADVYVNDVALANVPGAREAAAALGLGFPVPGEPWHVERVG